MGEGDKSEGWYRRTIGRKIEMGANRVLGYLLMGIALVAFLATISGDEFAFATHWPSFLFVAVFLGLARLCFRAKTGIIEGFGDEVDPPRKRD